jgi:hypothetical protein
MIGRVITTLGIWLALMGVLMALLLGNVEHLNYGAVFGAIAVMTAAATLSTSVIWRGAHEDSHQQDLVHLAKAKRVERNRVERLVESLDDDEIYQLEKLLLARDEDSRQHSDSR